MHWTCAEGARVVVLIPEESRNVTLELIEWGNGWKQHVPVRIAVLGGRRELGW